MSRSNPYKKKRRAAKYTLLIYGEGLAEELFLKLLRGLYAHNSGVAVTVKRGKGGAADGIVMSTAQYAGSFDERMAFLDGDKSKMEMNLARKKAKDYGVKLIENVPCLEALLLEILTEKSWVNKSSNQCKKEFEGKFMDKKRRSELQGYQGLFSKDLLEGCRSGLPILNRLIVLMEGEGE